ncbi:MAG TPA: hypothetical protein VE549_08080, partial [Myxococcaceae bacterium]|nr:hypothetical protein [Myxococcaceae bacterium]
MAILAVAAMLWAEPARAQGCEHADALYSRGREFFHAEQHLLAAIHFSQASVVGCTAQQNQHALFAYALSMFRLGETGEMLTTTRRLIQDGSADVARRARLLSAFAVSDPLLVESAEDHERLALWQQRGEPVQFERILLQSTSPFLAGKRADLRVLQRTMSELP